jgi:hypothetical protein
VRPSEYPELAAYPHLRELLAGQVDMQFEDVATLLQLPRPPELSAGCNLSLANILFTLIGGASALFFKADITYFKKHKDSGRRFRSVLRNHYPWQSDDALGPAEAAKALYTYARNPLTHSFGIGKAAQLFPGMPTPSARPVWLAKGPVSAVEADEILCGGPSRPALLPPTLQGHPAGLALSVPTLAWGTAAMCRSIFADEDEVLAAEALAGRLLGTDI